MLITTLRRDYNNNNLSDVGRKSHEANCSIDDATHLYLGFSIYCYINMSSGKNITSICELPKLAGNS